MRISILTVFLGLVVAPFGFTVWISTAQGQLVVGGSPTYDEATATGLKDGGVLNNPGSAVNSQGVAVGYAKQFVTGINQGDRAVRWDAVGTATELSNLGLSGTDSTSVLAYAINEAGTTVGSSIKYVSGTNVGERAVRWDAGGTATELGNLGLSLSGTTTAVAYAINEAGNTVGYSTKFVSGTTVGNRAVRWDAGGAALELGNLGLSSAGATSAQAFAINEAGTIVGNSTKYISGTSMGNRAVRWDAGGTATELSNLGLSSTGATAARAYAINEAGTTVGFSQKYVSGTSMGDRAVRWDAGGTATELGNLGLSSTGFSTAVANAVNEAGTTVGVSSKYDGGTLVGDRAVIWRHDGDSAIDLNDLGVAPVEAGGGVWTLTSAYAMSADGWVAGTGSFDPDGAGSLNSYTRHWVAQVGLGGSWTKASGGVWGRGPNWSSGTPATQVGDANFNLAGDYIVGLDRDETTRSISVNAGNVTLDLNNFQLQSTGQVSIAANKTLTIRDGNLAAASGLSIGAGGMLIGDATSSDVAVSGAISGAGGLTKTGSGVLTLSGVSTNTGATMIGDGTLRLGANGALPGAITIGSSATFDLNNFDTTIGSLTGAGAVTLGAGELATGGNNTTTTYSGDVSGAGGLTKTGSGVLSLSGANSYAGATRIHGGTLQLESALGAGAAVTIDGSATLVANASVARSVQGTVSSKIVASGGDIALGNSSTFTGFGHAGTLAVGSNTVTLNSRGYASLGVVTDLNGGVLQATNGILLGAGSNLSGSGAVNAKLAAGFGSIVNATGSLALGKATDVSGFFSDGELYTNEHTVTIHDKNEAVLGSLTQLGNGSTGGRLVAGTASVTDSYPHFLVEAGKNVVGRGEIAGHFKNQGHVIGDGDTLSERIVFESDWTVSGSGTFANTLVLGTFAPGNSPTISNGKNQGFGGAVQIEIGGLTPGNSNNNHDQINDSGTILVLPGTTLTIDPWNNFLPEFGNQFTVMSWTDGLDGVFDNVVVNPFYTTQGFNFTLQYNNVGGAGNLVLTAVLPGDLNGDVFVGQDDLNLILGNWGQDVPPGNPLADADGSGFVGQDDLNVVLGRWGQGNPPNVTPVPEPTTFLLMGLAGVGLVAIRRRRHWSTPIVYLR